MKFKSAFSLIELSIVILIIGILVAGITAGSRMINAAQLQNAQTLTHNSPILGISNLSLWFETSLESSFVSTEATDGGLISTWYDNNSTSSVKNNATQSTTANKPLFVNGAINGAIPAIRFGGGTSDVTGDYLNFDGTFLVGSNYTVFVVEQRRGSDAPNTFISGTSTSSNSNLFLGYYSVSSSQVIFGNYSNDLIATVVAYVTPKPAIHTFRFSTALGKNYWYNDSSNSITSSSSSQTTALIANTGSSIGRKGFSASHVYFNGDIAEIIIYSRSIKDEERLSVLSYLGKKYKIAVGS